MKNKIPPCYTKEQLRLKMMRQMECLADYWSDPTINRHTVKDRIEGAFFSLMVFLDGGSGDSMCSYDIVARPHPDDKAYHINEGNQWVKDGMTINPDCQMHDEWSAYMRKRDNEQKQPV